MYKHQYLLIKPLKDKSIVWFKNSNTYVLVAHETAQIIQRYFKDKNNSDLSRWVKENFNTTQQNAEALLKPILNLIQELHTTHTDNTEVKSIEKKILHYQTTKCYQINTINFKVSYQTEKLASLIHPKFEHLIENSNTKHDHHFEVFLKEDQIILMVDDIFEGAWSVDETHYFQGKFSMKLVEKLYQKPESDWLGVFHASAISDGHQNILFLGDSGNGKSTLAALLVSQGYTLFADDFVPVESNSQEVYYFPAAISVKPKAIETLSSLFPKLKDAPQIELNYINKSVKYLVAPKLNKTLDTHLPCKKLVFIKYKKDTDLKLRKLNNEEAFEQLIPDSWLSPLAKNAAFFMEWFAKLSCYSLTYSDNDSMFKCVKELYKNDV